MDVQGDGKMDVVGDNHAQEPSDSMRKASHCSSRVLSEMPELGFEDLKPWFKVSLNRAAEGLKVCVTKLKRLCRKNGISKWPYRQLKNIEAEVNGLKQALGSQSTDSERQQIVKKIESLAYKHKQLLETGTCEDEAKDAYDLSRTIASRHNAVKSQARRMSDGQGDRDAKLPRSNYPLSANVDWQTNQNSGVWDSHHDHMRMHRCHPSEGWMVTTSPYSSRGSSNSDSFAPLLDSSRSYSSNTTSSNSESFTALMERCRPFSSSSSNPGNFAMLETNRMYLSSGSLPQTNAFAHPMLDTSKAFSSCRSLPDTYHSNPYQGQRHLQSSNAHENTWLPGGYMVASDVAEGPSGYYPSVVYPSTEQLDPDRTADLQMLLDTFP